MGEKGELFIMSDFEGWLVIMEGVLSWKIITQLS